MAMTGVTGDSGVDDRYTAWHGVYGLTLAEQVRRSSRRSRARRVVVAVLAAVLVVVVVSTAVQAVVALARWDLSALLDTLVSPLVVVLLPWLAFWRRPPHTRVTADALVVRTEPWRTRTVPWADVVDVGPPGRFDDHPVARLTSGDRLALVGLPVEVAREMAEVTTPPRPAPRASAAAQEPAPARAPGDDLDGPFRRGRSAL